jgi:hypothetical protein
MISDIVREKVAFILSDVAAVLDKALDKAADVLIPPPPPRPVKPSDLTVGHFVERGLPKPYAQALWVWLKEQEFCMSYSKDYKPDYAKLHALLERAQTDVAQAARGQNT